MPILAVTSSSLLDVSGCGLFRSQILEQAGKSSLELVRFVPLREVRDKVLAQLNREILSRVTIEALPFTEGGKAQ